MSRGKSNKPVRWERLLMVLGNGGLVTLKEIEDTMEYSNMYRISGEIYVLKEKERGGVIKTHKQGRKVVGYELINTQEMIDKHLTPRGFTVATIVGRTDSIEKLADLKSEVQPKATKTKKAKVEETLEVEEVTE
jgi:hypothetical protein